MAQFDFPLEGVLTHRKRVEEECQRNLARFSQQMREAQNALRELDQSMQGSVSDVRDNRLTGKLDLGFLAAYRRYVASVQRKGLVMAQKMALIQRDIESAKKALGEAAKQRKIIEKLRENQYAKWKTELARKEAADLDEISMRLAGWQMAEQANPHS